MFPMGYGSEIAPDSGHYKSQWALMLACERVLVQMAVGSTL